MSKISRSRVIPSLLGLLLATVALTSPLPASRPIPDSKQNPSSSDPVQNYILGPEDVLTITVRNVPEFSGDYLVRTNDGTIDFPVVGQIKAAGTTPLELKAALEQGLKKELRDPQVTINVKQMRTIRVYVEGSVGHPGIFDYRQGWRISEVIAVAGGLTAAPEHLRAIVWRVGSPSQKIPLKSIFIEGNDTDNLAIQPGDTINVQPDANVRINVVGEVKQSGIKEILEGQGAVEALAAAGGESPDAALSKAHISRHGQDIPVDLYNAIINTDTSKNIPMEDGDTLYVPQQYAKVSVVGTVQKPGPILMPDGREMTLADAISEAGGVITRAKTNGVQLTRVDKDGKVATKTYNIKKLGTPGNPDPVLQNKDIIFVPQSGATNLNDVTSAGGVYYLIRTILGG